MNVAQLQVLYSVRTIYCVTLGLSFLTCKTGVIVVLISLRMKFDTKVRCLAQAWPGVSVPQMDAFIRHLL